MQKLNVIKVGGGVVENPEALGCLVDAFVSVKGPKVLVHGGGRTATEIAGKLGIESRMEGGRRITDGQMLKVVTMVYGGLINKGIVARLQSRGVNALGLTGADLNCILSVKRAVKEIDYGFVGDVKEVDSAILSDLIARNVVPVMAPLTHDGKGNMLNTNADTIASEVAKALANDFDTTLTFCFEKKGVLSNPQDDDSVIGEITPSSYESLKADGIISGGMIPKLENAFQSLKAGVRSVVITEAGELGKDTGTIVHL